MTSEESSGWGGGLWAAAGLLTPMAIRVAATLRLADRIAAGTCTADALAASVGANTDALRRLLAHLVTTGLLTQSGDPTASNRDGDHTTDAGGPAPAGRLRAVPDGEPHYGLTPLGEYLRDDHPHGIRAWLDLEGAVGRADLSFTRLLHSVRTGEPAFPEQFGLTFWEDLSADPQRAASFDHLMGARLIMDESVVAAAYPWNTLRNVVDVGGGNASLLIALLRAYPQLHGTVVDLAGPAARADDAIATAGLADRASTATGSFFDPLPPGADAYLLSSVLHNWDDLSAQRILRRCAEAAPPDNGRVLILDDIGESHDSPVTHSEADLRMLAYLGGRERTVDDLDKLAAAAGLTLTTTVPAGTRSLVELRRAS